MSLAITGVAGPGGGTADKPVGMVCFGWSNRVTTLTGTQRFKGDRAQIRRQAAEHAMRGLLELIRNEQ
ncbi:Nicotinamide-nucleotide amidohydrolase PncC [compost metagenome]